MNLISFILNKIKNKAYRFKNDMPYLRKTPKKAKL